MIIRVGELEVVTAPLSQAEWAALRRQLRAEAEKAGDYFTRSAKTLAAMKRLDPDAYRLAVQRIAELAASGPAVSDEQVYEYRESPSGVALELFVRGRKATTGLTRAALEAVITTENVDDILDQLSRVEGGDPKATA